MRIQCIWGRRNKPERKWGVLYREGFGWGRTWMRWRRLEDRR